MIEEMTPMLATHEMDATLAFYRDCLGFRIVATMGEPTNYALLERDGFSINFILLAEAHVAEGAFHGDLNAGKGGVYIRVSDVDALAAELVERGAAASITPRDQDYGMRDFWIPDPLGYCIAFGQRLTT